MFDKLSRICFCIIFICMLVIPLLTTNLREDTISKAEKRKLQPKAKIYNDDGTLNENFANDFETWINDNIGLRTSMIVNNAKMQFYLFDVLSNNSDNLLGPNGELNYATDAIIKDYQHLNLKTEEELKEIAESFQICSDYLKNKGIQMYYFQCWDKHSIYPEYFPDTIVQFGEVSKTDQIVQALKNYTDIKVVSPKNKLIEYKSQYDTYSVWGDATHWTQRGAFIGYQLMMDTINDNNNGKYKVLTEEDYDITVTDQGSTLFGGIHKKDYLEKFEIKNPQAYHTEEEPKWLSPWANKSRLVYYNDSVDNKDTLMILGDSYFDNYLYDDFAESFYKVVLIWGDYGENLVEIAEYYKPTIIIVENAERVERTGGIIKAAQEIDM